MTAAFNTIEDFKMIMDANDGVPFFNRKANSATLNKAGHAGFEEAVLNGRKEGERIFKSASVFGSDGHEDAFNKLKAAGSREQLIENCVRDAAKKSGKTRVYYQNAAYENAIASAFKPASGNVMDSVIVDKFKAYMKAKHKALGYVGDGETVENFFKDNDLSTADEYMDGAMDIIEKYKSQTEDFKSDWKRKPKNNQKRDDNRKKQEELNSLDDYPPENSGKLIGSVVSRKMHDLQNKAKLSGKIKVANTTTKAVAPAKASAGSVIERKMRQLRQLRQKSE